MFRVRLSLAASKQTPTHEPLTKTAAMAPVQKEFVTSNRHVELTGITWKGVIGI